MNTKTVFKKGFKIALLLLLILLISCAVLSCQEGCITETTTSGLPAAARVVEPLTPVQIVEYIDIFHMQCNKTNEQIFAGEDYILKATTETADLLFRINFFTDGLHRESIKSGFIFGSEYPLSIASEAFFDNYESALDAKEKYTGHLTSHLVRDYPFLRVEFLEAYPAEIYWFYKNIPEEILRRVYIDKDGMSLAQYLELMGIYIIGWDKGCWLEYDGTGNFIKLKSTDEYITYLNKQYFEDPKNIGTKELMKEYGLSSKRPLDFEWIISHPNEAYALITVYFGSYSFFKVNERNLSDDYFEMFRISILP